MDEKTYRARLDAQDWGDVHARLLDFAGHRCGKRNKAQAQDLAQQAIARVYAYDSKWDPEKEPDLVRYLMSVVNSLLWNERTSHAAQKSVSIEQKKTQRAAMQVADPQAWNADTAAENDLFNRRLTLLRERMADDAHVLTLIDCTSRGLDSPDEIRAATGWSANTLLAVRRRMQRAAALVARDIGGDLDESAGNAQDEDSDEEEEEVA
jgi:DNA-directed RNA polymerase specialized sigma24 family protein